MFAHPRQDLVAGSVVFLVAVPLCLGIAIASGMPPIAGIIAGIAGGLVAPWISRSPQSVTGPAAGLTSIVLVEVQHLGGIAPFLAAVVAAGALQLLFSVLRGGRLAALVPGAVIKGMLAAIGITIVMRQLPTLVGIVPGQGSYAAQFTPGALAIAVTSLVILVGWERTPFAKVTWLSAALVVVLVAASMAWAFGTGPQLGLAPRHFVQLPGGSPAALFAALPHPAFAALAHPATWMAAITVAIVASIETLLSLQAIDRLDPLGRTSAPDRELLAQGVANIASGLMGGLPVTAVIVRGGANIAAGGRERLSALVHGILLLVSLLVASAALNRIPLAALAAVLVHVGVKLCAPQLVRHQFRQGRIEFVPYVVTIVAILATDLLKGVLLGTLVSAALVAMGGPAARARVKADSGLSSH